MKAYIPPIIAPAQNAVISGMLQRNEMLRAIQAYLASEGVDIKLSYLARRYRFR